MPSRPPSTGSSARSSLRLRRRRRRLHLLSEFNKLLRRDAVCKANRKKKKEGPVEVIEIVSLPSLMPPTGFEQQVMREEAKQRRAPASGKLCKQTRTDRRSRDTREGAGSFVQR